MTETDSVPIRMILPPDGRQTRIEFFGGKPIRKSSSDWWQSLSSWFRFEHKVTGSRLEFFAQQLEKEGYSEKSRKSYVFMMNRFFNHFENMEPCDITMGEIEDYNFEFFVSGRYSRSYQLQFINAIKLYYHLTEGIDLILKQLRKTGVGRKSN
ncbi:MAG: phage integrase N-terminal SAM-like domain-containing protein [Bacteroidales bacterium]|nr:phage integrase N-terminal SAM-like domain-containing protein [Bacteroidales bacterium]